MQQFPTTGDFGYYNQNFTTIINPITCDCFLTKNKNRLKKNLNNISYLDDDDNFEIEIYNPNTYDIGVKIKFDNNYISDKFLVIHPGQRIYLDRFIDTNNKFLFKTYLIKNNENNINAIQFNGNIEIDFYYYKTINYQLYTTPNFIMPYSYTCTNTIETGRIEQGENSEQIINNSMFNCFEFNTCYNKSIFLILPISQKPIEIKNLVPVCTSCKTKNKKHHLFCFKCGTKI